MTKRVSYLGRDLGWIWCASYHWCL